MQSRINAILSDYDGTLVPTKDIKEQHGIDTKTIRGNLVGNCSNNSCLYYLK